MSKFTKAAECEAICWDMKLADLPRAQNRALIQRLFNGEPPYSPEQAKEDNITVNSNFLDPNRISADARGQYSNALLSTENYFKVRVDRGPRHRRSEYSEIITSELRKQMKSGKSALMYREQMRNVFAQLVLHGIGPVVWDDRDCWCPSMQAMGDVMTPSGTLLTMENLSYFTVYRRFTAAKLYKLTHGPKVSPFWNMDMVRKCLAWAARQYGQTLGGNDISYNPERIAEDFKADTGIWSTDQVPTIDAWDFWYLDDSDKQEGWKRKVVLDCPSFSEMSDGNKTKPSRPDKSVIETRGEFLYDGGKKNYASSLSELVHWQFADGCVVAPFRYHSVRSLGFLLYSVCHLQNRLRCSFTEAAFEACLQYFRANNVDEAERAIKVNLVNRGIIPDGVNFVPQNERWVVNAPLIEAALNMNKASIDEASSKYVKDAGLSDDSREKSATEINALVNASAALVGAMLEDCYSYEKFKDMEIARRFCRKNSRDGGVRAFRAGALRRGVPEDILDPECWEIIVEQIMGKGNKQVAVAEATALMQNIDRFEPDSQRVILRDYTFAITGNAGKTMELVPMSKNTVTDSIHDAQLSAATLLRGLPMGLKQGVNHTEYAAALLAAMQAQIAIIEGRNKVATKDELAGLQNIAGMMITGQPIQGNGVQNHIAIIASNKEDPQAKQTAKQLGDALGKMMNMVKAYQQRAQEQAGAGNGQPQIDPETAVKLKGKLLIDQQKAENLKTSHEQRMAQRDQQHKMQMANEIRRTQVQESATDLRTAGEIKRNRMKALNE